MMEISYYYSGQLNGYWVTLDGKEVHFSKDEFDRDTFIAALMMIQKKIEEGIDSPMLLTRKYNLKISWDWSAMEEIIIENPPTIPRVGEDMIVGFMLSDKLKDLFYNRCEEEGDPKVGLVEHIIKPDMYTVRVTVFFKTAMPELWEQGL